MCGTQHVGIYSFSDLCPDTHLQRVNVITLEGARRCSDGKVVRVHPPVANAALREYDVEFTSFNHGTPGRNRHNHSRTTKKITVPRHLMHKGWRYSNDDETPGGTGNGEGGRGGVIKLRS